MNKMRIVIGMLLMVLVLGASLTGCQNVPPPQGYNCKTENGWGTLSGVDQNYNNGAYNGPYTTVLDAPGSTGYTLQTGNGITDGSVGGSADSYMLTWSNSRYYTAEELSSLSKWELQVARNEIYARHGVRFGTGPIQDHFLTRSWYHPTVDMSQFNASVLNDYETANINMLQSVEATK